MKKLRYAVLVLLVVSLAFSACKKNKGQSKKLLSTEWVEHDDKESKTKIIIQKNRNIKEVEISTGDETSESGVLKMSKNGYFILKSGETVYRISLDGDKMTWESVKMEQFKRYFTRAE